MDSQHRPKSGDAIFSGVNTPAKEGADGFDPQAKVKKTKGGLVKKAFKILFVAVVAAIWALVLLSIMLRRDDAILETPILSENARKLYLSGKEDFPLYRVYPPEFMTADGALQLSTPVYAPKAGEFEIGVRIAWSQLRYCEECDALYTPAQLEKQLQEDKKRKKEDPNYKPKACLTEHTLSRASLGDFKLYYTLTDTEGNTYAPVFRQSREKKVNLLLLGIKYEYERISFAGLYFDLENNIINRDPALSQSSAGDNPEEGDDAEEEAALLAYYFRIYDKQGGHLLFSAKIYDDNTYVKKTAYSYPDEKYTG